MIEFETDIFIRQPVNVVFEFLTRCENIPRWVKNVVAAEQTSSGTFGAGSTLVETVKLGWRKFHVSWVVTDFEQDVRISYKGSSFLGTTFVSYTFEPVEGGTNLSARAVIPGGRGSRLVLPFVKWVSIQNRKQLLRNFKRILEGEEG